jgi:acyl carrier protein
MSAEIELKLKQIIINQLGVEEGAVVGKAKFIEDLGADSLDIVELVMAMEEAFGVDIPDEEAENIRTVDDAINYVTKTQGS